MSRCDGRAFQRPARVWRWRSLRSARLGSSLLRRAWFDLDCAWAGALVLAGLFVLAK